MSALPEYSDDETTCVKCGMVEAQTEYMPGLAGVDLDRAHIDGAPFHNEFLKRTCVRCEYMWAERCLDYCERCKSTGVDPEDSIPAEGPSDHSMGEPPVLEPCRDCTLPGLIASQVQPPSFQGKVLGLRCTVCQAPAVPFKLGETPHCALHG